MTAMAEMAAMEPIVTGSSELLSGLPRAPWPPGVYNRATGTGTDVRTLAGPLAGARPGCDLDTGPAPTPAGFGRPLREA
jgi:hypothetical protein